MPGLLSQPAHLDAPPKKFGKTSASIHSQQNNAVGTKFMLDSNAMKMRKKYLLALCVCGALQQNFSPGAWPINTQAIGSRHYLRRTL